MKKITKVLTGAALIAAAVFTVGCEKKSAEAQTIKIGAMYALSGDKAAIGNNIMRGVDFAVDMINAQGGVNGRKIEIVRGDTQGDPKVGRSVAERLVTQDKVNAILGCHQSTITAIAAQVCEQYKIPEITAISTVDNLSSQGLEYFFRMCPTNTDYVEDQYLYLKDLEDKKGVPMKNIAIFADNSNIGQELIRCSRILAPKYGFNIVAEVQYSSGTTDLTSEVLKIRNAKPDAVLCESYIADAILFTKTLTEQNAHPPVIVAKANGFADPSFIPATPGISNGIASVVEFSADFPKGKEINDKFKAKYGVDMNGHSAESFTAIWILKTAFEQAGSTDGTKVRDALASMHIVGQFPNGPKIILPYNEIKFGDEVIDGVKHHHNNIPATVAIAQIQNGEWATVWPFEEAAADVQYPAPLK
ncbi:ABC transporter substrate-binding protein [uncultured Treponema sp.]|uniref:ABC transporter substrate-binding protein n=1 Tax=uncultured Treponema sp. TaxID=162155 RepID=UPI0025D3C3BC|nr:ABC transporter substrate-binding protein [uncultured Treponema sp.]